MQGRRLKSGIHFADGISILPQQLTQLLTWKKCEQGMLSALSRTIPLATLWWWNTLTIVGARRLLDLTGRLVVITLRTSCPILVTTRGATARVRSPTP